MRGRNLGILMAAMLVAALAGWWFASPSWTLQQMRDAASAKDTDRLSAHIDYPALRADLKDEWSRRLLGASSVDAGSIEGLVAATIAGPLIDAAVSPRGVQAMFDADELQGPAAARVQKRGELPRLPAAKDQPVIERDGLSQFRVHARTPGSAGLVFRRYGFSWKLAGVDLAPVADAPSPAKRSPQ